MNRDPIVEEIHQTRQKIWEECNGDLDQLLDRLQAAEKRDRSLGMTTIALPIKTRVVKSTESLIRSILGAIPSIGTALNEAVFDRRARLKQERLEKFVTALAAALKVVESNKIDMAYIQSEEFVDFLEDVLIRAAKARAEDKRRTLAAVVAGRLQHAESTPFDDRFLDLLMSLSDIQVRILTEHIRAGTDEHSNAKHRQPSYYDLPNGDYLFLVQDLISKALLYTDQISRGDPSLFSFLEVTELGRAFIRFLEKNTTHAF